jgi:hypothetical protein
MARPPDSGAAADLQEFLKKDFFKKRFSQKEFLRTTQPKHKERR